MPAPVDSTIDAMTLSPTRRQRMSIMMSGRSSEVRRISSAFSGSQEVAPATNSAGRGITHAPDTDFPRTGGRVLLFQVGAGRTRTGTDPDASTNLKVVAVGATGFSVERRDFRLDPDLDVTRSSIPEERDHNAGWASGWALAGSDVSERLQSRFSANVSSARRRSSSASGGARVVSTRTMANSAGDRLAVRAGRRRSSSVHYRVGSVPTASLSGRAAGAV
jgi:hypothetical protein